MSEPREPAEKRERTIEEELAAWPASNRTEIAMAVAEGKKSEPPTRSLGIIRKLIGIAVVFAAGAIYGSMHSTLGNVIAAVLVAISLVVLGTIWFAPRSKKTQSSRDKGEGRKGTISKINFGQKAFGGLPVTIFEIHELDGQIFHAGLNGHETSLANGDIIEFWPSSNVVAMDQNPKVERNNDGTTSRTLEEIKYCDLERYRIVREEVEQPIDDSVKIANQGSQAWTA